MMETEKKQGMIRKWIKGRKVGKDQFVICILAGILLIVIAMPVSEKKEKKEIKSGIWDSKNDIIEVGERNADSSLKTAGKKIENAEEYEGYMEAKLEQAITAMEGAGKVKVIVTVNTSRELVVEKDNPVVRNSTTENDAEGGSRNICETENQEETVYTRVSDGSSTPYVVKTLQPVVEGVVVIAQGADKIEVRKNITEAIVALFDIDLNKIKVVKMKSE